MFHTIARLRQKEEEMKRESKKCNALEHVPACSTWPPPWLAPASSTPARVAAGLTPELRAGVSLLDLPPELFETWQERVCIMHYDGRLPWQQAEVLALADVLGQGDLRAGDNGTSPAPEIGTPEEVASAVQAGLFARDGNAGPYI